MRADFSFEHYNRIEINEEQNVTILKTSVLYKYDITCRGIGSFLHMGHAVPFWAACGCSEGMLKRQPKGVRRSCGDLCIRRTAMPAQFEEVA